MVMLGAHTARGQMDNKLEVVKATGELLERNAGVTVAEVQKKISKNTSVIVSHEEISNMLDEMVMWGWLEFMGSEAFGRYFRFLSESDKKFILKRKNVHKR